MTALIFSNPLSFLFDSYLATIVTAGRANGVVDVELAAVRTNCQCGSYCLVVSSSLEGPCLGLSSFRMCHIFYNLTMYDVQFYDLRFTVYYFFFFPVREVRGSLFSSVRPIADHSLPLRGRCRGRGLCTPLPHAHGAEVSAGLRTRRCSKPR